MVGVLLIGIPGFPELGNFYWVLNFAQGRQFIVCLWRSIIIILRSLMLPLFSPCCVLGDWFLNLIGWWSEDIVRVSVPWHVHQVWVPKFPLRFVSAKCVALFFHSNLSCCTVSSFSFCFFFFFFSFFFFFFCCVCVRFHVFRLLKGWDGVNVGLGDT